MSFRKLFLTATLALYPCFAWSMSKATQKTMDRYTKAAAFEVQFSKIDKKKTLGTTQQAQGTMIYSQGKFKMTLQDEKKSEILFNGEKLWVIEYPDLDLDPAGKRKVMVMSDHKPALAQQLMALFQNRTSFNKNFKTKSEIAQAQFQVLEFEPIDKGLKNFTVSVDNSKKLIKVIEFTDDVQTQSRIEFTSTTFLKKSSQDIFTYKRKKDDQIL